MILLARQLRCCSVINVFSYLPFAADGTNSMQQHWQIGHREKGSRQSSPPELMEQGDGRGYNYGPDLRMPVAPAFHPPRNLPSKRVTQSGVKSWPPNMMIGNSCQSGVPNMFSTTERDLLGGGFWFLSFYSSDNASNYWTQIPLQSKINKSFIIS